MDLAGFVLDVERTPDTLRALADLLDAGEARWPEIGRGPVVLLGMGSSWFAADTVARHLRAAGVTAVADYASVAATLRPSPDLTVVGITASGGSAETLAALSVHHGTSRTLALTNTPGRDLPADHTVLMHAGPEDSGVACRSYVHTLAMLLQMQRDRTGAPDIASIARRAADATEHLLATRDKWLPTLADLLAGPSGTWLIAPAERLGSALQGALMLREGPRRPADGCETGDWSHVDVYLTKSLDYRALLFAGSGHDPAALQWMGERGTRFAAVGAAPGGAAQVVRHPHDDDPLVALLAEIVIPDLVAARWWAAQ